MIRDRDVTTAKRVIGLSEKGSTERLRAAWEQAANRALAAAGHAATIDRRTLEAQRIAREPGLHVGHTAPALEAQGLRPESREREGEGSRIIDYPAIDAGRTRAEANAAIAAANRAQALAVEAAQIAAQAELARQDAARRLTEQHAEARRLQEQEEQAEQARQMARAAAVLAQQQDQERAEFVRYSTAGRARAAVEAAASVTAPPRARGLLALFRWLTGRDRRDRERQETERRLRITAALRRHAAREQKQRIELERRPAAERAALPQRQAEWERERDRARGQDDRGMEL
jgi:hypothetical protein